MRLWFTFDRSGYEREVLHDSLNQQREITFPCASREGIINDWATSRAVALDWYSRHQWPVYDMELLHDLIAFEADALKAPDTDGGKPFVIKDGGEQGEVERIAKELRGKGSAIFRYLSRNPRGVTFSEYQNARCENGHPLTTSDDRGSIAAMLRRMSREQLDKHGWEISAAVSKNLIKLEKLSEQET